MNAQPRIAIAWNCLPFYGSRLIRAGIDKLGEPVTVIASQANVPITGLEEVVGCKIYWIDSSKPCSWIDLGIPIPEIFFHTGWAYPGFNALGHEIRQHGGRVISMVDNCWKNNLRQWLGAVVFRLKYKKWFDAVWVPGASGFKLCRFLGMPQNRIYHGMYGADPEIFTSGLSLSQRDKQFLFVGQLIQRKGIDLLVEAFQKFHKQFPDWTLKVVGTGPLDSLLDHPGIIKQGFQQSLYIAEAMQQSRFLILPSYEEHWGLVVHEATLSGCGLIVSDRVGASLDLVCDRNGIIFPSGSSDELYKAMVQSASLKLDELDKVSFHSLQVSSLFGPYFWAKTFVEIITSLSQNSSQL